MQRWTIAIVLGAVWPLLGPGPLAAEVTVEKSEKGAIVKLDGSLFTEYLVESGGKPVLWPVIGPTGKPMTRAWPILGEEVEGEKRDHPHHRSIWFTHGKVGGHNFWLESKDQGLIVHRGFDRLECGPVGTIVARNEWQTSAGKKVCEDERTLTFGADGERRWIDFDITLKATAGDVAIEDDKEGTFGVRVAGTMKVDARKGGRIVTSEGQTDKQAWGKAAAWVDYHGPVEGEVLGIAILNHPTSFRFPTTWHVRTYGLFAANPFGYGHFKGKPFDGAHTIRAGETLSLRYRVLLHKGNEKEGRVAESFAEYSQVSKGEGK